MNIEIFQYCLSALLSLDAEQQAAEAHALIHAPLAETKLFACMESHGEDLETAIVELMRKALSDIDNISDTKGAGHGENAEW